MGLGFWSIDRNYISPSKANLKRKRLYYCDKCRKKEGLNNGQTMEYMGILYRRSIVLFSFMLIFLGETMNRCKRAGLPVNAKRFCLSTCKYYEPFQNQLETAKTTRPFKLSRPNKSRYLELSNRDIYDVDSNTILSRKALQALLVG